MHLLSASGVAGCLAGLGWFQLGWLISELGVFHPPQPGFVHMVAGQGTKKAIRSMLGFLKPRLGSQAILLLSHSVGRCKLQGQPTFKRWGKRLHL